MNIITRLVVEMGRQNILEPAEEGFNNGMVDHTDRVIAVFNGKKGGTKNTIDYADRQNVPVLYIP